MRGYWAGIARKAAATEALLLCIVAHMRAAALHGKLLPVKGLYRAGMQTWLLDTS